MSPSRHTRGALRAALLGSALAALSACDSFDIDLRPPGMDTTPAVRRATAPRPAPDDRGVISYPNYQVVVARPGDTVADVARRIGLDPDELARYNGLSKDVRLRGGEILALPRRVSEPSPATGAPAANTATGERIDITTLADNAISQAGSGGTARAEPARPRDGVEPIRHKVERGETAYSIARLYNVSVRALAEWNGLGPDLSVREGQYLLIPVARDTETAAKRRTTPPGKGSPTPPPPSAAKPLPRRDARPTPPAAKPPSPDLGSERTAASGSARLAFPVEGKIIRAYSKDNEGIDIAAPAGTPVRAADAGTVAAITRDTDKIPILVIRHAGGLLTVYANIDGITVKKGDRVKRGQKIAVVRKGKPTFVHFEVRKGIDAVDPMPYLN